MFLHLGQNTVVQTKNIIGIFDLDTTTMSQRTRLWLSKMEKKGKVFNVSQELPKSFILYNDGDIGVVYISQLSASTLMKRKGI